MSDESTLFSAQDIDNMQHVDHNLLEEIFIFSYDHDSGAVYGVFMHYLAMHDGKTTWLHDWMTAFDHEKLHGAWLRAIAEYAELARTQQTTIIPQKYAKHMMF
jgi:hypothetical protein